MKEKIYLISDAHWGHENIIRYCGRPFANAAEMTEKMIANWNSVVDEKTTVISLGDMFVGCELDLIDEVIPQLKYKKWIYVRGNHCSSARLKKIAAYPNIEIKDIHYQNYGGLFFLFCHFPMTHEEFLQMVNIDNSEVVSVFGHVHDKVPFWNRWEHSFNVSADVIDYTPISISKLFRMVREDFAEKEVWRENGEEI
jgi:calcineurin-like phosphoesterase family protein